MKNSCEPGYVCFSQMVAVPLAAFVLHVGQTRTFSRARTGDTIVCVGRGDTVRLSVPTQLAGANRYRTAWDKKLLLTLGPRDPRRASHPPGVLARCTAR